MAIEKLRENVPGIRMGICTHQFKSWTTCPEGNYGRSVAVSKNATSNMLISVHAYVLNATYFVQFSASVTGAVALHKFVKMTETE